MRLNRTETKLLLAISSILATSPAIASEADPQGGDYHDATSNQIVVTAALPGTRVDALSGVAIITGADLATVLRSSIGETLAHTPGVSATSFGPNASRPILRGLQGERVRVLSNGIGSIDVSNTSVDHAAAVNPLLAERIEVLRGPQSLLYGSAAMGGVVNVIDRRIPNSVPDEPLHLLMQGGLASAADERNLSASADAPIVGGLVVHVDGSYLKSNDMRIGGYALTPALRSEALASGLLPLDPDSDVDFAANAAVRGRLPNTASETWTAGAGLGWIGSGGKFGVAFSHTDSLYGVPLRFATLPGQEQEAPQIKLRQDRVDARGEIKTGGRLIEKASLRFGNATYDHAEIAEDGSIGTTFFNKGLEARLELTQAKHGNWQGVVGAQFASRNFNVVGDEAFLPKNTSREVGLFTVQQIETDALKIELGARFEHSNLSAEPDLSQPQFFSGKRQFDTFSASAGAAYTVAREWKLGLNISRTSRAPSAEELFANGPHAGTQSFEIGDPDLRPERAWGAEAILRGAGEGYSLELSAYHNWYSNFMFDARTGAVEDGLPVFQIRQADARIYGFEAQAKVTLVRLGGWALEAEGMADYVHAEITGFGPSPRIPPLRLLGGLGAKSDHLDVHAEVERVTAQNRLAPFETATPGYTMVNANVVWRPNGKDRPLSVILSANNIFDVAARRHASFLKDYALLSGRDVRLVVRMEI
jgi:iron complex outermembrane receptor protein